MRYDFPSDIQRRVRAQMKTGQFATEDDVLREAIDTLEKRQHGLRKLQDMVREADEDIFNADETKDDVRKRLEAEGIKAEGIRD